MHNTIKATTLWLMLGYAAPLTNEHYTESIAFATSVCNEYAVDPDHQALEAWLSLDLNNAMAAVNFMHHHWHINFNVCGADNGKPTPEYRNAVAVIDEQFRLCLQAIVFDISAMPGM